MRTVRSLPYGGVSLTETPLGQRPPWTETPPDRDPPSGQTPPGQRPPSGQTPPPRQRPSWTETPWSCDLWCMLGQRPPPKTESQTSVKTLPCSNFVAGGNYLITKLTFSVFPSSVLIESEAKLTEILWPKLNMNILLWDFRIAIKTFRVYIK